MHSLLRCILSYLIERRPFLKSPDLYFDSLFHCWLMFLVFRRRHYDKAPVLALSNLEYWKRINHPVAEALFSSLYCFDEYAVENFHSVLRSQTKIHDNEKRITAARAENMAENMTCLTFKQHLCQNKDSSSATTTSRH